MKKIHIFGAVCALLGLLLWGLVPAGAQDHRVQSRAKVWDVFWNNGVQGVNESTQLTFYRPLGFSYPGQFWVQLPKEFENYWGVRFWSGATQWLVWEHEFTALMPGFNTFVATKVDGDPAGVYHVASSKPASVSADIRPMTYDPSKEAEAKIGYPNYAPLGPPMANWWPGQSPLGLSEPVEVHNYRYFQYMDPDKDAFPESTIIIRYATKRGIMVTKKVYTWSYPDHDDFQILDYEFENTGDSDGDGKADLGGGVGLQLNDTFFAFSVRFHISQNGHAWQNYDNWYRGVRVIDMDDWYKYTEASNYNGPASGKGLKMWYAYDGDNPLIPGDDIGQPYLQSQSRYHTSIGGIRKEGEITAYQYAGFAPLAYTPSNANDPAKFSYDTKGDARYVAPKLADQPYAVKWWDFRNRADYDEPDQSTHSFERMYSLLAGPAPAIMNNPIETDGVHATFAYGPYDLKPGDRVRVVLALVAAAPVEENIWGWAKLGLQAEMKTDKAFNNLVKHLKASRDAFKWGYDLPDPPPDVKVKMGVTTTGSNLVSWESRADDALDPDYVGDEAKDVKGYRVYRSEFKYDDWQLVADVPVKDPRYYKGDRYEVADPKSVAGFQYYYSARAYDKGHSNWRGTGVAVPSLEAGVNSPEQWADGVQFSSPYVPPTPEANRLEKTVTVVPNPYKVDGSHAYPARGSIRFINIPGRCKISIYTVMGELFAEIDHSDAAKGEVTWTQIPADYIEEASPGIYYFVVESLVPESLGKKQRGAFMIIK